MASLRKRNSHPVVEIHPETAYAQGIKDGMDVWLENRNGRIQMKAKLESGLGPEAIYAQYGWWFPEEAPPDHGWKKSNLNLPFREQAYDPNIESKYLQTNLCNVYSVETK